MALKLDFDRAVMLAIEGGVFPKIRKSPKKRLAPFSIRLSEDDRARLAMEAAGAPLGTYIKSKVLAPTSVERKRRNGLPIQDREALAQALALLGRADLTRSLSGLLELARIGSLPDSPETMDELHQALQQVLAVQSLLLSALGGKP